MVISEDSYGIRLMKFSLSAREFDLQLIVQFCSWDNLIKLIH